MPSDKYNMITDNLIFSLLDIALTWEVPFGTLQYLQFTLPVSFVSLLTVKSVDLVVACDGFLFVMEIVHVFCYGYFDYRDAFQTVLDLYCCVIG